MNFCNIKRVDVANGTGIRLTLFVSGCTNHCKGCFQPETWDFNYGQLWTKETENNLIKELSKPHYKGLTLLGGEPFEPQNQVELVKLLRRVRSELPNKDVWCFTGFLYENLVKDDYQKRTDVTDEMLSMIDVLVDGPFIESLKNLNLKFRGSENQRVINLTKTRECGNLTLMFD